MYAAHGSLWPTSAARTTRSTTTCTHEQCSLAEEGELAGTTLTCTCHGSEFDVRTGKVLAPPATVPVKVYPVRVAGDALQIEV